jgi:hypothetical protein
MPGVAADPLLHYLLIGVNRDCHPNPLFDSSIRNGSSPNFLTNKKLDYGAHCSASKVNEGSRFASPMPSGSETEKDLTSPQAKTLTHSAVSA